MYADKSCSITPQIVPLNDHVLQHEMTIWNDNQTHRGGISSLWIIASPFFIIGIQRESHTLISAQINKNKGKMYNVEMEMEKFKNQIHLIFLAELWAPVGNIAR